MNSQKYQLEKISYTPFARLMDAKVFLSLGMSLIPIGENKQPLVPWKEFHTEKQH